MRLTGWQLSIMATSPYSTTQYTSEQFVESCGAILFDLSDSQNKKVCLIYHHAGNEWLFAKGRRNCGESRHKAALREVREETGYHAHLYLVTMYTRAPPIDEQGHMPDKPRSYQDLTEPFMVTIRQLGGDSVNDVKIIWWYIAALDEGVVAGCGGAVEEEFMPKLFSLSEAKKMLSFQNDIAVLEKAIKLVESQ
jgi:8-oxo-dGTP pyrophosphatase MutT (NUDIX family)